jgi:hypothetical protein
MAAIINDVDTMEYASIDLENDKIFVLKLLKQMDWLLNMLMIL